MSDQVQTFELPCSSCSGPACEIAAPQLGAAERFMAEKAIRMMCDVPAGADVGGPLFGLSPATLASALRVRCILCADAPAPAAPALQVVA